MLLEFTNLKKYYYSSSGFLGKPAKPVKAVDGVSLSIKAGEHFGLVGESGCGKTTLGRLAVRLLCPDEGTVAFQGQDLANAPGRRMRTFRKDIQMVFQDPFSSLDPRFRVYDLLAEAILYDPQKKSQKIQNIQKVLSAVKLPERILHRFPHEFSGGERQRIAIARALLVHPKLLILDEAVSSLDVLVQEEILNLLLNLQREFSVTYFFISHNLRVVKRICQRIAVMFQGKIVELGSQENIFDNPLHPYTRRLLKAAMAYRVSPDDDKITLDAHGRFKDQGEGHYVFENSF